METVYEKVYLHDKLHSRTSVGSGNQVSIIIARINLTLFFYYEMVNLRSSDY